MTLFDEYPPKPGPANRARRDDCCDAWATFVNAGCNIVDRASIFIHRWGHRRTPFSVDALAEIADTDPDHAGDVIAWAVEDEWIVPVYPEFPGQLPEPLWIGRLAKER
jgi:hypothetical protein